ncbi:uronyl 2-sulfotransferase-like isoform X1 [Styela clava]
MFLKRRFIKRRLLYLVIISAFMVLMFMNNGHRFTSARMGNLPRSGKHFSSANIQSLVIKKNYDDRYLIFNRVPKCGSMSLTSTSYSLGAQNGFKVASPYEDGEKPNKSGEEQMEFIKYLHSQTHPFMYIRHQYFIDFENFGEKQPIYINMIRDPIARFESFYYFSRFGNQRGGGGAKLGDQKTQETIDECVQKRRQECTKPYWQVVPYFCGQEPGCMSRSRWALDRAKENIKNHYVFVGTLEDLDDSLKILEHLIPRYFKNAAQSMKSQKTIKVRNETYTRNKRETSEAAKIFLRTETCLSLEYELYDFVRERLYQFKDMLLD